MIQRHVVQGSADGPHLLITGGVHGDEFAPMATIRRLITEIDPRSLSGKLTLVPVVNEAAYLNGARTAKDGLDLARVCPGDPNGSETQQIAHEISLLIESAEFYIDLHTGSTELSVLPLSGYALHRNETVLNHQRAMARAFNLPVVWGTCGTLPGRTLSVARDANIPAIYTEYLGQGVCDSGAVDAYRQGCLNVMSYLKMLDVPAQEDFVSTIVEDDRDSSGHMQIQNQTPTTGFFEPLVKLGDDVQQGDPLGTVCNVLGDESQRIGADRSGKVIGLRTYPRVLAGDTLAVIMEHVSSS